MSIALRVVVVVGLMLLALTGCYTAKEMPSCCAKAMEAAVDYPECCLAGMNSPCCSEDCTECCATAKEILASVPDCCKETVKAGGEMPCCDH